MKKAFKSLFGARGVWKNHGQQFLRSSLFKTSDGVRPIMIDRDHNVFEYIKNEPELEKKIFSMICKND